MQPSFSISSGSIDDAELDLQLQAVEAAVLELFQSTTGTVDVTLIAFSHSDSSLDDGAVTLGTFSDIANVAAALDAVNEAQGGDRPFAGRTNYSAAIPGNSR